MADTQHIGLGKNTSEIFRKFVDGVSISAEFVQRSLSSIRGSSAILPVEWSNFSAHTYFNSAELKANAALTKVIGQYPIGLSGISTSALASGDVIAYENFLFKLNGFEKYVLNYLGGVTGNSYLNPDPVLTAMATTIGGIPVSLITLGRNSMNGLTGDFITLSANLLNLAQSFDAGVNTVQLISGTAVDFDIIYFDDGSYYTNRVLPYSRIEYVNRQSNMGGWMPEALKMADTEDNLVKFMGTVGSIYDDIKLYIDQFANVNHISYDNWNRYPDGRIPSLIAKHFGFELIDTLLRQDLSKYLRRDTNKVALYEITYKIWNRILNNLIYLYKKKGTMEAVRSLIRIYGIPDNYLSIDDFNFHPEPTTTTKLDYKNVRVLNFDGSDRINFNGFSLGTGDLTLEARVSSDSITSAGCILSYGDGTDNIEIEYDGVSASLRADNTGGDIKVSTSSNSTLLNAAIGGRLDTDFVNFFAIRRSTCAEIWATWIDDSSGSAEFNAVSAIGAWPTLQAPATLGFFIGATTTGEVSSPAVVSGFVGQIHEVKAFKFALGVDDIREHTENFESVSWMGNAPNGSFDGVVGQWKLKENTVLSGSNWVVNAWTLSSSLTGYGQGSLTSGNRYSMIDFMPKRTSFTNIGQFADDNVDLYIQQGVTSPWRKSNILNIGFRPVTRVNDDILNVYADLDVSSIIGDPANFLSTVSGYSTTYPVEAASAGPIFRRWFLSNPGAKIDFNNYIDVLENLSPLIEGIMHDTAQLIPARTTLINRGVIIEKHLLESSRVHTNPPNFIPQSVYTDVVGPTQDFTSTDETYAGKQFERREEIQTTPLSTNDYLTLSQPQLQSLDTDMSVSQFRVIGNSVVYPFFQSVADPSNTQVLVQANRNFLSTSSKTRTAENNWQFSVTGTIKLVRNISGKLLSSQQKCVQMVIPTSTTADTNGQIIASENLIDVEVNGILLDDTISVWDFRIPDKNGLVFKFTNKTKNNDLRIGFLTFQISNLLSGNIGQYTILMSVDESGLGGVAELNPELAV